MAVDRLLPTEESVDLLALVRDLCEHELAPHAAEAEESETFPRDAFRTLGKAGLLGLPYPEEVGGAGQPYEVYLQVLEEIAAAWMRVGVGVSVHAMSCYPLATFGTDEQRERWLPEMLGGDLLGGYACRRPTPGPTRRDAHPRRPRRATSYVLNGTKAWVTHGGEADFYTALRPHLGGPHARDLLLPRARRRAGASAPARPSARWA